jgi:hypothetical protein
LVLVVLLIGVAGVARGQEPYPAGVDFPRPTPAALDSLLRLGVVPIWLKIDPSMYWTRSMFSIVGRATYRTYMTQAIQGGIGAEGGIGVPLGLTDFGIYLFARANNYHVTDRDWLGWITEGERDGVLFNGGVGASFAIPLKWKGLFLPLTMNAGAAFFQSQGGAPAETYLSIEPGIGVRYRMSPRFALQGLAQSSYMVALANRNRNIGSWNLSFGLEVALAPRRDEPLQHWVPPLVATSHDVVRLLATELVSPLNVLDRNLDFINTELKPLTRIGWYPFGFRAIVRGTIKSSSRAASGNVTALDIELDSADRRGMRVWRTSIILDSSLALAYMVTNSTGGPVGLTQEQVVLDRIKRGDYAYRGTDELGPRFIRVELFPRAKGPLDRIPESGSRVEITGDVMWDGDGHVEIHPRRPSDVRVIIGQFLDTDDERNAE